MSLGEDISVKFTVDKSVGANACLKVSFDGKRRKTLTYYTETDGGYMYVYTGLAPQDMAKDITVKALCFRRFRCGFARIYEQFERILEKSSRRRGEWRRKSFPADTPLAKLIVSLLKLRRGGARLRRRYYHEVQRIFERRRIYGLFRVCFYGKA